ncbi:MAG: acetate--CoA ligase family protein, partial [Candidatus Peribacteraceae bacterium]|nr:acetate--CoA ligase family protein [Candidatus Peribacteraceae bacterium]
SVRNPVDVLGDALADRYEQALKAAVKDPNIDGAIVILTPQIMTPAKAVAEMLAGIRKKHSLFPFVACFMGGEGVREAIAVLHANGIPNFSCPESAMHILASLRLPEHADGNQKIFGPDERRAAKALRILEGVSLGLLNEEKTEQLLELYELPAPRGRVAATADEAVKIAEEIGYPVTAKVSSKEILHKTEIGGVIVNLVTEKQVREAFDSIVRNAKEKAPKARVAGVLIQQCLAPGNEFIVGGLKDETAGHLIMVGLGGVYTELFKDTSFRVAPVSADDAYPMLTQLKSWKLLLGMRGKPQLDIDALAGLISVVSLLITECPQIREIDLNPVLVSEKSLTILDAKIVLG